MFSNVRQLFVVAGGALVALGLTAHATRAEYVSFDTRLPSPNYRSTNSVIYQTPGGAFAVDSFFDIFYDAVRIPPPPEGSPPVIQSFFDVFTELSLEPLGTVICCRESPTKQGISFARLNGLPPGEPVLFDTEMLQLDISGGTMPPGVMIRESPTRASLGRTSIDDLGGGLYRIGSFFDVFTELSLDGGQTWNPGLSPLHLEGGVPEPSTLMLAGLAMVAGTSIASRRARRGR